MVRRRDRAHIHSTGEELTPKEAARKFPAEFGTNGPAALMHNAMRAGYLCVASADHTGTVYGRGPRRLGDAPASAVKVQRLDKVGRGFTRVSSVWDLGQL